MTTPASANGQLSKKFGSLFLLPLISICLYSPGTLAQSYYSLQKLPGYQTQVYFSPGAENKAQRMAEQIDRVTEFYNRLLNFRPSVTLLILSPADWLKYSKSVVYGMPHYTDNKSLVVAAENNEFWKSFIPPADDLPKNLSDQITKTYSGIDGIITMEPFFDLLAIHELGHAYHKQAGLSMQRNWMSELFVNIFLHSYIAENEPQLLPALTIFPKMVVSTTDKSALKYTTLKDLEDHYDETAQKYPRNYGWYQCRWHMAAATIYDSGSLMAFKNLWLLLKSHGERLTDEAFADLLAKEVHQTVADVWLKWENSN